MIKSKLIVLIQTIVTLKPFVLVAILLFFKIIKGVKKHQLQYRIFKKENVKILSADLLKNI